MGWGAAPKKLYLWRFPEFSTGWSTTAPDQVKEDTLTPFHLAEATPESVTVASPNKYSVGEVVLAAEEGPVH